MWRCGSVTRFDSDQFDRPIRPTNFDRPNRSELNGANGLKASEISPSDETDGPSATHLEGWRHSIGIFVTNRVNRTEFRMAVNGLDNGEKVCQSADQLVNIWWLTAGDLEGSFVKRTTGATRWARGQRQGHPRKSILLCSFLALQLELFRLKLVSSSFAGGW